MPSRARSRSAALQHNSALSTPPQHAHLGGGSLSRSPLQLLLQPCHNRRVLPLRRRGRLLQLRVQLRYCRSVLGSSAIQLRSQVSYSRRVLRAGLGHGGSGALQLRS